MKKLLVVATLSIAVVTVVNKFKTNSFTVPVRVTNKDILESLLNDVSINLEELEKIKPELESFK